MAFSAADSALEGFRITRERPLAVLGWAGLLFLNGALSSYVLVTLAGPALQTYTAISPNDTAALMQTMSLFMRAFAVLIPLWLIVQSVIAASVNRVVLRPDDRGFLWLKLGADELRQGVVLIVIGLISFAAYMAAAMVMSLVAGIAIGAAGLASAGGAITLATVAAVFAAAFAFLLILARLAVASPMTFDLKRIEIFSAARVVQGRFGQMIGAYLLALCMVLLVDMLVLIIFFAIASVAAGGFEAARDMLAPKVATLSYYFSPLRVLYLAFTSIMSALSYAIWYGVAPRAYQQLRGQEASAVFR